MTPGNALKPEDCLLEAEAAKLGRASAAAGLRLDCQAPAAFQKSYITYKGPVRKLQYFEKKCIGLRLNAVKRGFLVDSWVSAEVLANMAGTRCPVSLCNFEFKGQNPSNLSVDRLYNDGTYAAGNLAILTQRVNTAKGSMPFEEILELATGEQDAKGLLAAEWERLACLTYGAWDAFNGGNDPYLMPLTAYPGHYMFTTQSQFVQVILLNACAPHSDKALRQAWRNVTRLSNQKESLFMEFAIPLSDALVLEGFPPAAWLVPNVFPAFVEWYRACRTEIYALMEQLRAKYQSGLNVPALLDRWSVESSQPG